MITQYSNTLSDCQLPSIRYYVLIVWLTNYVSLLKYRRSKASDRSTCCY